MAEGGTRVAGPVESIVADMLASERAQGAAYRAPTLPPCT